MWSHNRLKFLFSFRVSTFRQENNLPKIKVLIYITESFKIVHFKKSKGGKLNAMNYKKSNYKKSVVYKHTFYIITSEEKQ